MKTSLPTILAFALGLGLASCSPSTPPPVDPVVSDIREATFRYQFQMSASGGQVPTHPCFIGLATNEPKFLDVDVALLKRFEGTAPRVKRVSECDYPEMKKGISDKASGERGTIYYIREIKRVSETEVEVSGGIYSGLLSADEHTYYLKRTDGKWSVTRHRLDSIS